MGLVLRYSFGQSACAERAKVAARSVLADGYRTADIFQPGTKQLGATEMGDAVVEVVLR